MLWLCLYSVWQVASSVTKRIVAQSSFGVLGPIVGLLEFCPTFNVHLERFARLVSIGTVRRVMHPATRQTFHAMTNAKLCPAVGVPMDCELTGLVTTG